jgi:ferrous iron transport protein A
VVPLSQLQPGQSGKLHSLNPERAVDQRLMALGLLPGMVLKLVRKAPLGDPLAIEFAGQVVSLRLTEAENILIDVAADCPVPRPRPSA